MENLLVDLQKSLNTLSFEILEFSKNITKKEDENFVLISFEKISMKISKKSEEKILYCGVVKLLETKSLEFLIKSFITTVLMEKLNKALNS